MNINYLFSILDLYLLKENDNPLIIEVHKNNNIKVELSYSNSYLNKTYVKLDNNIFNDNLKYLLNKIQGNKEIKNESLDNNIYKVIFNNNREINFINFNIEELEIIRNNFNNLNNNFSFNKVLVNNNITYNEIYKENKQTKLNLNLGFTSFITIFLTSIWFLDIFMIALWIFKSIK